MLKGMKRFLVGFWEQEVSQVSKVTVLNIGTVLAVLAVAALPQTAVAANCAYCGPNPNCDFSQCSRVCACAYEPCELWRYPCAGPSWGYYKTCSGGGQFCSSCTCA